jgi:hypothetical protein
VPYAGLVDVDKVAFHLLEGKVTEQVVGPTMDYTNIR